MGKMMSFWWAVAGVFYLFMTLLSDYGSLKLIHWLAIAAAVSWIAAAVVWHSSFWRDPWDRTVEIVVVLLWTLCGVLMVGAGWDRCSKVETKLSKAETYLEFSSCFWWLCGCGMWILSCRQGVWSVAIREAPEEIAVKG